MSRATAVRRASKLGAVRGNFLLLLTALCFARPAIATQPLEYDVRLEVASDGFDGEMCWVHARAGIVPTRTNADGIPLAVLTMQKLLLSGSDVFYELHEMRSDDGGRSWQGPFPHDTLARRDEPGGVSVAVSDFWPTWHAASGTLLGTGHTVRYLNNRVMHVRPRETAYSAYDPQSHTWTAWQTLTMPDLPEFANCGAGCTQRYDLPDGDILLPVYFKRPDAAHSNVTVLRCGFDGKTLTYKEHGTVLSLPVARGLGEPSLTRFGDRFYLTLRNDEHGYVTSGADGLHFDPPRKWTFCDGEELGNYNTQQHWVTHSSGLFLVYTRRGLDNDHVFRHRAPLVIAQVDPERLCILRDTERILVPEAGARLGNFGVTQFSPEETWVTVTEWMQPRGVEKYGSDNRVFVARLIWSEPNELAASAKK